LSKMNEKMTDLQVSIEASEGLERRMKVQIPGERIKKEIESRLISVRRTAKLKGFRPGKVPERVIRQHYGGQVRQEVLQEIIESSYSAAILQEKLRPAAPPTIEPGASGDSDDFSFTAVFEIYPEIELRGLDGLKVEQPELAVDDSDIDEMIETLRKQRAEWSPVDHQATDGDRVTIDFVGTLNNEPFEGSTGNDVPVIIGQGQMLEAFEKNLKGLAAGDEKTFTLKFPEDYHAKDIAGQKASFTVTAKEVAAQKLPEIDAEFIKSFGVESGELAALREDVRRNMGRESTARIKAEVRQQIMEQLLAANPIDIPKALAGQEAESLRSESLRNLGMKDANDPDAPGVDLFREAAERRVQLGLLVAAVVEDNQLEVDRDRVKAKVDEICEPYDQAEDIRKMYFQNPRLLARIENAVIEEQVVAWLVDKAQVEIKSITFNELMAK